VHQDKKNEFTHTGAKIMFQNYEMRSAAGSADETLERLVAMTNQTNLVALDKTMAAIRRASSSYAAAAARVGMTLPADLRASTSPSTRVAL
jgi:predicted ArsR family transcriptional regulator